MAWKRSWFLLYTRHPNHSYIWTLGYRVHMIVIIHVIKKFTTSKFLTCRVCGTDITPHRVENTDSCLLRGLSRMKFQRGSVLCWIWLLVLQMACQTLIVCTSCIYKVARAFVRLLARQSTSNCRKSRPYLHFQWQNQNLNLPYHAI